VKSEERRVKSGERRGKREEEGAVRLTLHCSLLDQDRRGRSFLRGVFRERSGQYAADIGKFLKAPRTAAFDRLPTVA
jgi:hypothetical protein